MPCTASEASKLLRLDIMSLRRLRQPAQRGVQAGWDAEAEQVATSQPKLGARQAVVRRARKLLKRTLMVAVVSQDDGIGQPRSGVPPQRAVTKVKPLDP